VIAQLGIPKLTKVTSAFPIQSLQYTEVHVKCQLLSDFNQNGNVLTDFNRTPQYWV
jgi:hypothetical protein